MLGFLASLASRAIPYIPRIANFIKTGIQYGIPSIIKGISRVREFAGKIAPVVSAISAGVETAKNLPWIGEKVKEIAGRPAVTQTLKSAENILKSGGAYLEMLEKDLPTFQQKYLNPLLG